MRPSSMQLWPVIGQPELRLQSGEWRRFLRKGQAHALQTGRVMPVPAPGDEKLMPSDAAVR